MRSGINCVNGLGFTARRFWVSSVLLVLLGLIPANARASINYGTHAGTNVIYVNVTEDSGTDPIPLYGPPTVTGNSIDFNPVGFEASTTGASSDLTSGNLTMMILAKPGNRIDKVTFSEIGDTTMAGNVTPGSMGTATAIFASGVVDIQEVDFVGINHISVPFAMTFNPSGGTYFLGTDGGGGPLFNTQWSGNVVLDLEAILLANGITGGATKVSVDLDNDLSAVSQLGTSALIAKKDFGGLSITAEGPNIPEPATLGLAAVAAVGLLLRRPR